MGQGNFSVQDLRLPVETGESRIRHGLRQGRSVTGDRKKNE